MLQLLIVLHEHRGKAKQESTLHKGKKAHFGLCHHEEQVKAEGVEGSHILRIEVYLLGYALLRQVFEPNKGMKFKIESESRRQILISHSSMKKNS